MAELVNIYNILEFAPELILYSKDEGTVKFNQVYTCDNKPMIGCTKHSSLSPIKFDEFGRSYGRSNQSLVISSNRQNWENWQVYLFTRNESIGYVISNKSDKNSQPYVIVKNGYAIDKKGFLVRIDKIVDLENYNYASPEETTDFFLNHKPIIISKKTTADFAAKSYIIGKSNYLYKSVYQIIKADNKKQQYLVRDVYHPNKENVYIYYDIQCAYYKVSKNSDLVVNAIACAENDSQINKEKEIKEIVYNKQSNKKDIPFKPGTKVLCRDSGTTSWYGFWCLCEFSHIYENYYIASGRAWDKCIPYNKYTEDLIGTDENYEL